MQAAPDPTPGTICKKTARVEQTAKHPLPRHATTTTRSAAAHLSRHSGLPLRNGGGGLEGHANHDVLAVADAALDAARPAGCWKAAVEVVRRLRRE